MPAIDALVLDVQGTLLDFHTPVRGALADALARRVDADVDALTNAWRATYFRGMRRVTSGERPFVPTSILYREGLDEVLATVPGSDALAAPERDALTDVWTRLTAWPDTVEGLHRLRRRYRLVALTNGGMAATIATAARYDLGLHAILSTELIGTFKPAPAAYRFVLDCLGLPAGRVMMVASHPDDLQGAHAQGLRTAFIERPLEFGPACPNRASAPEPTDIVAVDLVALAVKLGVG